MSKRQIMIMKIFQGLPLLERRSGLFDPMASSADIKIGETKKSATISFKPTAALAPDMSRSQGMPRT